MSSDTTEPEARSAIALSTPPATPAPAPEPLELAVEARELRLDGKRGRIYGPVDLALGIGSLTLVTGRAGSGKTALLLTLAGRMRPNRGSHLTVLGKALPGQASAVQHASSAVGIHGLDDLDEEVSVGATIREREAWLAPWYRIVRAVDDERVDRVLAPVFGEATTPTAKQLVHELDEADNLLLRIALAVLSEPALLVVDDIDQLHDTEGRGRVWQALRRLADSGVTVIVSAASPGELTRLGWDQLPGLVRLPAA